MLPASLYFSAVAQIVTTKESKIKEACLEITVIVNDLRAKTVGGMEGYTNAIVVTPCQPHQSGRIDTPSLILLHTP